MAAKPTPRGHVGKREGHKPAKQAPHGLAHGHHSSDVQGQATRRPVVKPAPKSRSDHRD
jgi:hypothetical protein